MTEKEVMSKVKDRQTQEVPYETSTRDLVGRYRDKIKELLKDREMTAKQVWRLLKGNHSIEVGCTTIKRYLLSEFLTGEPKQQSVSKRFRARNPTWTLVMHAQSPDAEKT